MTTSLLELFSANDATLDLLAEIDPQGREANPAIKLSNGKLEDLAKQLCTGFARRSPAGYGMANLLLLEGRDSFPQGSWAWGLDLGWLPDSDPCPWLVADVLPLTASSSLLTFGFATTPRMMLYRHYFATTFLRTVYGEPVNTAVHNPDRLDFNAGMDMLIEDVTEWNASVAPHLQMGVADLELETPPPGLGEGARCCTLTALLTDCTVLLGEDNDQTLTLWRPYGFQ